MNNSFIEFKEDEMKNILTITLLLFFAGSLYADTFSIGGKELDVPSPKGFSRITQQMDAVYRLSLQMSDPVNDQLACYISESDIPVAMVGKIPSLERYCILKVNKELKEMLVGSKDFAELKSITKQQNKDIFKSVESQLPALMEKLSKGISKEFDVDLALQVSQAIPLDPHYETDNIFSYSIYANCGASVKGSKEKKVLSATATFINVSGKILFLYCYGSQNDLEWTRDASKAWTDMIIDSNPGAQLFSLGGRGMDWGKIFAKATVSAVSMGLLAVILVACLRFKKRKD
ncbi:MAG TPA: hypothetical protein DET40_20495 [Lentisphaeria bacterium]|nr:MAG: hypothetical protein A2X45_16270 [Lentisphaerae bacterium GWF2_50_93]HCE45932.1 hypothetical protein [Lentisphaeria bacterium]